MNDFFIRFFARFIIQFPGALIRYLISKFLFKSDKMFKEFLDDGMYYNSFFESILLVLIGLLITYLVG